MKLTSLTIEITATHDITL